MPSRSKAIEKSAELAEEIGLCFADPYRFVILAYPWGKKGTILENESGPDQWQIDVLRDIGDGCIKALRAEGSKGKDSLGKAIDSATRIAVASGNGIGKTALMAWIIMWFCSTRPHCQVEVLANTLTQLSTRTWRELAKWHKLSINKHWFEWTATKFYHVQHPETWFAAATPWSEEHPEASAGMHERDVCVLMDEGSGIPDIIWQYKEPAMTTPGAMWIVFGNPTRNQGRFFECFGRFKHRWNRRQIDSRTCRKADMATINNWIEDYGEDSDFVRVRVKGEFPRASDRQFIPTDVVQKCVHYEAQGYESLPKLMGVDVARFGEDASVICVRQGRKVHAFKSFHLMDVAQLSQLVVEAALEESPEAIFIDAVGIGAGVVDRVRQLGVTCIEVNGGSTDCHPKYRNKRAEMWGEMRAWLKTGAEIPDDKELLSDLTGPEYLFTNTNRLMLERKEDMKRRGLNSPDKGDALAMTFAYPVGFAFDTSGIPEPEVFMDGI